MAWWQTLVALGAVLAGCEGRGREASVAGPVPTAELGTAAAPSSAEASARTEETTPQEATAQRVVTITADGRVLAGEKLSSLDALFSLAQAEVSKDAVVRIALRADRSARWKHVITALDRMRQGGVERFDFLHEGLSHPFDLPKTDRLGVQMVLGVDVHRDGALVIDGAHRTDAELAADVRAALIKATPFLTVVRADGDALAGRVLDVYAALRDAGAPSLAFAVTPTP